MIRAKAGRKSLCRVAQLKPPLESTKGLVGRLVGWKENENHLLNKESETRVTGPREVRRFALGFAQNLIPVAERGEDA